MQMRADDILTEMNLATLPSRSNNIPINSINSVN